jgi:two-component system NtrC family response regulator
MKVRGTLLLVDDEEKIRRVLGQALRAEGHDVIEAAGAGEAQRVLAERDIDVLIIDNLMPDMTGLDLIRELVAATPETDRPEILMMTAHATINGSAPTSATC